MWWVTRSRASKRRRNSLTVNAIRPSHFALDSRCCRPSGWPRRGVRRSSSNSCDPDPRPSLPSTRRHAAAVHTGRNAARSDRSPPRTPSTTDQGLPYEPRRPRPILESSQTPNNAAVTAPTSADTPQHQGHDLRLQYYFSTVANIYLWDPEWGGPFWKTNAFAPLPVWIWLIGHSVYANDWASVTPPWANGFRACDEAV